MKIAKDGVRSIVRIGYDGRVIKTFRGTNARERFTNEIAVLEVLEARDCSYVPQLLDHDDETMTLITTNCGQPVQKLSESKTKELFQELEDEFGVVHDDPYDRNITYDAKRGRFCVIDFELAHILGETGGEDERIHRDLKWAGVSQMGRGKKQNEDHFAIFASSGGWAAELPRIGGRDFEEEGMVVALSDGMGGQRGGFLASSSAVRNIRKYLPARMGDFRKIADPLGVMMDAVKSLHWQIKQAGKKNPNLGKMGATLICGLFYRAQLHFAHVGDSRIYRFRKGQLLQLTEDHSMVGYYLRNGKLTEREARSHPRRNIVNQVIAAHLDKITPQVNSHRVMQGDWYLFCSDGVVDGLWDHMIEGAFEEASEADLSPEEVLEGLMKRACQNAGKDDTTAVVLKVL